MVKFDIMLEKEFQFAQDGEIDKLSQVKTYEKIKSEKINKKGGKEKQINDFKCFRFFLKRVKTRGTRGIKAIR